MAHRYGAKASPGFSCQRLGDRTRADHHRRRFETRAFNPGKEVRPNKIRLRGDIRLATSVDVQWAISGDFQPAIDTGLTSAV